MQKDLERAIKIMNEGGFTCVLVKDDKVYTSKERGVKPLLSFLEEGIGQDFYCADKVVGRGAGFLYLLLKVKAVYAEVLSEEAKSVFDKNGLNYFYGQIVDRIQNRKKDGLCPIEECVINTEDKEEAYRLIKNRLIELSGK